MSGHTQAIFVFGSNLAGMHGGGAARYAREHYGAKWGQGEGLQGDSYAVPTMDARLHPLPLHAIAGYAKQMLADARAAPERQWLVTRVGCGIAGYTDADIAPMFAGAPPNVELPAEWRELAQRGAP